SAGVPADVTPVLIPFGALISLWPWSGQQIIGILTVVLPALICAGFGLRALWQGAWGVQVWALLLHTLLFVVLLSYPTYYDIFSTERVPIGVMLAALYCVPVMNQVTKKNHTWLLACVGLWLALLPWLFATDFYFWAHG